MKSVKMFSNTFCSQNTTTCLNIHIFHKKLSCIAFPSLKTNDFVQIAFGSFTPLPIAIHQLIENAKKNYNTSLHREISTNTFEVKASGNSSASSNPQTLLTVTTKRAPDSVA